MPQTTSQRKKSNSKVNSGNNKLASTLKDTKLKSFKEVKVEEDKNETVKQNVQSRSMDKNIISKVDTVGPNRFQVLSFEQVKKLHKIIDKTLFIKPNVDSSLSTIKVTLRELLGEIRSKLKEDDIIVKDIRLNMDVASSILNLESDTSFKIVDVVFTVTSNDICIQQKIKNTVFKILINMLRTANDGKFQTKQESEINDESIKDNYIRKMARTNNSLDPLAEAWSLISIGMQDSDGQTVEMKFIDKMKRQYEFTVDSFQIILDTLLAFYTVSKCSTITPNLFPTVVAESVSGSFQEAIRHLKERIIFTRQPEEICGGGLLKYCKLLVDGYKQEASLDIRSTEKYMCSRFFIDNPEISAQKQKIESYLNIYFYGNTSKQSKYLHTLCEVVSNSTVCLMIHERRQTLQLINGLIQNIVLERELKKSIVHLDDFNNENWILDQVFYGTHYFPQQVYVTSPMNTEDPNNLSFNEISGNQILICTGDNTDLSPHNNIISINQAATVNDNSVWIPEQNSSNQVFCCPGSLMCA